METRTKPKQKRGERRVAAILDAASEVFSEVTYENATIMMIATRANTSVGSLYQFFINKEDILRALVERYVARATVVFEGMNVESFPGLTLEQSLKIIFVPLKEFLRDNRDFRVIFSNALGPTFVAETIRAMDDTFLARNDAALALARPQLSPKERRKYSLVCMVIMKAMLGMAHQSGELTFDEVFEEMEAVFLRYLTPIMGE